MQLKNYSVMEDMDSCWDSPVRSIAKRGSAWSWDWGVQLCFLWSRIFKNSSILFWTIKRRAIFTHLTALDAGIARMSSHHSLGMDSVAAGANWAAWLVLLRIVLGRVKSTGCNCPGGWLRVAISFPVGPSTVSAGNDASSSCPCLFACLRTSRPAVQNSLPSFDFGVVPAEIQKFVQCSSFAFKN